MAYVHTVELNHLHVGKHFLCMYILASTDVAVTQLCTECWRALAVNHECAYSVKRHLVNVCDCCAGSKIDLFQLCYFLNVITST
jgi:hypothetical protein